MSEKLKPCPFCGSKAVPVAAIKPLLHEYRYKVSCVYCGVSTIFFTTEYDAMLMWNARVNSEK